MKVGLLTLEQKEQLVGQLWQPYSYFAPRQDADNNWIISTEEIDGNVYEDFSWVTELPLIHWNPKPDLNPGVSQ
jgi:hypothetical protein